MKYQRISQFVLIALLSTGSQAIKIKNQLGLAQVGAETKTMQDGLEVLEPAITGSQGRSRNRKSKREAEEEIQEKLEVLERDAGVESEAEGEVEEDADGELAGGSNGYHRESDSSSSSDSRDGAHHHYSSDSTTEEFWPEHESSYTEESDWDEPHYSTVDESYYSYTETEMECDACDASVDSNFICEECQEGVGRVSLDDVREFLPDRYQTGYGQICNDVDISRRQLEDERVKIPDRFTASLGVENRWNQDKTCTQENNGTHKTKTFKINGEIVITEEEEGSGEAVKFDSHEGNGVTDGEKVVIVGDNCGCESCKECDEGSDSDSSYYYSSDDDSM